MPLKLPKVVSCLVLVSAADRAGAEDEGTLGLPNLKIGAAEKDGTGEGIERLVVVAGSLLLGAVVRDGLMDGF